MTGRTRLLRWAIPLAVVPVLVLLAYGFRTDPREIPSPLVGKPASRFALTAFDGKRFALESLRGEVVVVNFWASWCYPACYEEAPSLERAWQIYKDRGLVVDLGHAVDAVVHRDAAGRIGPVDGKGRVRFKRVGPVSDELLKQQIEPLLAEGA
jgi:cytochrome c biogenesis protein CcmG/thiol:disulfide interchange protein DsbE